MISVEVVYAKNLHEQLIIPLQVAIGTTVETAIRLSGILEKFTEIDLQTTKVGIFSKIVALSEQLNLGDRIEIYRSLIIDPKQARLVRAKRKKITNKIGFNESNSL